MQCKYQKSNGEQCQGNAMKSEEYCFAHHPDYEEKRLAASAKGGSLSRKTNLELPPVSLQRPTDVVGVLEETINGVRDGSIPPNIANTLAYICSHALRAMEAANLDGRLEIVESILLERKTIKKGK